MTGRVLTALQDFEAPRRCPNLEHAFFSVRHVSWRDVGMVRARSRRRWLWQ